MFFTKNSLISTLLLLLITTHFACPEALAETAKHQPEQGLSQHPVSNPFAALTESERDYYNQSFSYALQTLKEGQIYEWRTATSFGSLRAGKRFKSKSNVSCRTFSETFDINGKTGELEGYGCKRDGRDGWCKLRDGNMLNCSLEPPDGIIDTIMDKANQAPSNASVTMQRNKNNFWNWWPF